MRRQLILIWIGIYACTSVFLLAPISAHSQSVLQGVDLTSADMSETELSREEIIAMLASGGPVNLTRRRLNGLDLSGLDLSGANLRAARMNNTSLKGANLRGANLDQAWMMGANLVGADLAGASLFQTQVIGADLRDANLTGARTAADFSRSDLSRANFSGADFSADMQNQSMGLMRGVLHKIKAEDADFSGANFMRADLEFANLRRANFTDANLMGTTLGGADFTGANVDGARFGDADLTSTRLVDLEGVSNSQFDDSKNLDRAFRN